MRPCKIWASYGGRCIEKILAPKSKYIFNLKPERKRKTILVLVFHWCKSLGIEILSFHGKKCFVLRNGVKGAILEGSKTALSKF